MAAELRSGLCHPETIYHQLNGIKPGMMEEATKSVRVADEQFSRDSHTKPGKLTSAAQGWFQIKNRDAATPEWPLFSATNRQNGT